MVGRGFNSQRDGILLMDGDKVAALKEGFNSQRDGILLRAFDMNLSVSGFNSQRDGILQQKFRHWASGHFVSIPNGMEFYVNTATRHQRLARSLFQFPTGWNSTSRDAAIHPNVWVSIPNGMEFYAFSRLIFELAVEVSIPNGMEFYPSLVARLPRYKCVSIPNGMEFYMLLCTLSRRNFFSFNSQRDGILR